MAAQTAPNGVKTLALALSSESDSSLAADANVRVAVGRTADEFVLVAADEHARQERSGGAYISTLSVLVSQDPFPGMSMAGNQMIWVKNYSENQAIVPQLERAGFIRLVGSEIKQGFVKLPLAEVTLHESEMLQQCAMPTCGKWETTETMPRFRRCSKCKRRYYCSTEHQHQHWPAHKVDCKDLVKLRFADVENRRRAGMWPPPPPREPSAADSIEAGAEPQ